MDGEDHGFDAQEAARKLLEIGQSTFTRGTVKDAVAWTAMNGQQQFAWILDPLRMVTNLGIGTDREIGTYQLASGLKRAFHVDETDFDTDRTVNGGNELIWRLQNTLGRAGAEEGTEFTLIPEPGYPWPTKGDEYYSAKRGKMVGSPEPKWLIEVPGDSEDRGKMVHGVDLCQLYAEKPVTGEGTGGDSVVAQLGEQKVIVTHALGTRLRTSFEEAGNSVERCGGLLLPSLAVGAIPATNFGMCILVARVGLVLQALKPYRARGIYPVHVYDTDAWTGTTGEYMTSGATAAFSQLHGHDDYMWNTHIWPLGAPTAEGGGPGEADFIMGTKKLAAELKRRFKKWPRNLTPEKIAKLNAEVALTVARYAYLEAKVDGVVPMKAFPVAVCPRQLRGDFEAFLGAAGWKGELLALEVPHEVYQATDDDWLYKNVSDSKMREAIKTWAQLQYGWHVADELAKRGPVMNVELA